jgi:predicted NBD/HSP70 family sugar kinase
MLVQLTNVEGTRENCGLTIGRKVGSSAVFNGRIYAAFGPRMNIHHKEYQVRGEIDGHTNTLAPTI